MNTRKGGDKRWLIRGIVAVALGGMAAIGVCIYCGVTTSIHAEKILHATNLTTIVVSRFVQQEKKWPTSWSELQIVDGTDLPSMYSWPDDVETISKLVSTAFDTDLNSVASQTVDSFDSIKPTGACYPYRHYGFIKRLITSARATVDENREPTGNDLPASESAAD